VRSRSSGGIFQRPKKSGIWWISYYSLDRKRHRERAGRRDEALQLLGQRTREVSEGKFTPPTKSGRTFRDIAAIVLAQKQLRLRPQSYETDCGRLDKLLPIIGSLPIEQVTSARLEQVLGDLKRSGLAGSTVNRYRSLVSSIFTAAVRQDLVAVNPLARVKPFKESAGRVRYLLEDEETRLRAVIRRDYPDRIPELDLALNTGMRRGEQWSLKWSDVDFRAGQITVFGKTGRRHIQMNSAARSALTEFERRVRSSEYVCEQSTGGDTRDWRRWLETSVKRAGIPNFHWHDLRHTFASRMVMAGVDIRTVQELLGHRDIKMTMRYSHLSPDHRATAVEKIVGGK
jgi:site-specific recombinase XerD